MGIFLVALCRRNRPDGPLGPYSDLNFPFYRHRTLYVVLFLYFKVWSHPGWAALKTLTGHEQKISCVDVSPGLYSVNNLPKKFVVLCAATLCSLHPYSSSNLCYELKFGNRWKLITKKIVSIEFHRFPLVFVDQYYRTFLFRFDFSEKRNGQEDVISVFKVLRLSVDGALRLLVKQLDHSFSISLRWWVITDSAFGVINHDSALTVSKHLVQYLKKN